MDKSKKAFEISNDLNQNPKGFHMRFANGWTVSVQWGAHNYANEGTTTAEVAAWDSNGKWYDFGDDPAGVKWGAHNTVKGYCSPNEVATFIAKIAACKPAFKRSYGVIYYPE